MSARAAPKPASARGGRGSPATKKGAASPAAKQAKNANAKASSGPSAGAKQSQSESASQVVEPDAGTLQVFSQQLIRLYVLPEDVFGGEKFLERVWEDVGGGEKADEVSAKEKLLPWLSDRLGLSATQSRSLLPTLTKGAERVPKSKFLDLLSRQKLVVATGDSGPTGASGVPQNPSPAPSQTASTRNSVVKDVAPPAVTKGAGAASPSRNKTAAASAAAAVLNATASTPSASAAGGVSAPVPSLQPTNTNPLANPSITVTDLLMHPVASFSGAAGGAGASTNIPSTSSMEPTIMPTLLVDQAVAGQNLGAGQSVDIHDELEKIGTATRIFESSQKRIMEELGNIRKESDRAKASNFDISAKLRDVLTAMEQQHTLDSARTQPSARLPQGGRAGSQGGTAAGKDGLSATLSSARTDITKISATQERDKERLPSKHLPTPAPAAGQASKKDNKDEETPSSSTQAVAPTTDGATIKQDLPGASTGSKAGEAKAMANQNQNSQQNQEKLSKQLDSMRRDLQALREELSAEITRREEAELDAAIHTERVMLAEKRQVRAESARREEERRAREMQRCLELLQEDVVKRTRATEVKYLEQERRMNAQNEMYKKMHRLGGILPAGIIQKSFAGDL
mmetsp:Transcript_9068/g.22207  ORF Transcript_9068/g.22207 Transcript_9068/m.22207 type:complete len:628 (+) Transcript_9068:144-2027(+)|eukprot:CAMPEP_0178999130 /NCGR_PEP_ID=MMETSP0795-20121207/9882_1 /TAXON_ID=88552 /ORGANISM="Amoebophrya sp., Strain Ameob2" /LENGTH=627 /DNA_ID=CAMNT_0020691855 /DNA_START=79 /DNA_END=1962 /DNA_ORIENTATION=-